MEYSYSSVDIPQFFICPISLQIMTDPVTAATGITYDRSSIERWLFDGGNNATCPVTNQPLPPDSDLTPNHTLRRLIQAWCTINAVDRIPTPQAPVDRPAALSLLSDLCNPSLRLRALSLISSLASASETNRRALLHAGAPRSLLRLLATTQNYNVLDTTISVIHSLKIPDDQLRPLVADNNDLVDALTSVLLDDSSPASVRGGAVMLLKSVVELGSSSLLERLKVEFFRGMVGILVGDKTTTTTTKAAVEVMLRASPWGQNRTKMVEAGAVRGLIELELEGPERRRTELVLGVLDNLCGCAEGRAELVGHAAGVAVVAKRMLTVSAAADERAVGVLAALCRYSATGEVVQEMLRVGAVSKLCLVMQADCSACVREKARWVLRLHSGAWSKSSCSPASYI